MKAYPEELLKLALEMVSNALYQWIRKIFSTMVFIHSDLRNRLGVPKVQKLTFGMRYSHDIE